MRPTVLFLDEVMAGLNCRRSTVVALIKRIRDRGNPVVIEHVMTIRDLSDRILVLFHGGSADRGSPRRSAQQPRRGLRLPRAALCEQSVLEIERLRAGYGECRYFAT
jgi:ABC-type branched-subunit amino acid transport system ATPase component